MIPDSNRKRLEEKTAVNPTGDIDEPNIIWSKLKTNIKTVAIEAVGTKTDKNTDFTKNMVLQRH